MGRRQERILCRGKKSALLGHMWVRELQPIQIARDSSTMDSTPLVEVRAKVGQGLAPSCCLSSREDSDFLW